jgi:prepilin-type N-terminal cleavage/methylation domain-containing protein
MDTEIIKYHKNHSSGFTLVELSMVIVIIGLLVAGVIGGQNLVQNAKLQNVVKEIREYDAAITAFKDKFKYYPGDLPTAASYWGTYAVGPPITGATNGNGNWQVEFASGTEDFQFWRQLALAGFIPGTYTGAISGARYGVGVNAPGSVITGGSYQIAYVTATYGTNGNFMQYGSLTGNAGNGHLNGQIMSSGDAYLIDTKIDDGLASSGSLYTARSALYQNDATRCASANFTAASATYLLADKVVSCRLFWWLDKSK